MPYYAVARGRAPGIYQTWADCEAQVKGFSGARYKKFDLEKSAQEFIKAVGGLSFSAPKPQQNQSKYYAGTAKYAPQRNFSTSSMANSKKHKPQDSFSDDYSDSEDYSDSDDSDDLSTMITKQMDDIEKRVKQNAKVIDKIMKTNKVKGKRTVLLDEPPVKKRKSRTKSSFEEDSDGFVQVYTDGACSSNGRSCAKAGLGVYWGDGHALNTSKPVSGRATNNCGEIQAATYAIKQAVQNGVTKLAINTDSKFLINSVTKWMPGWKRKGWKLKSGEPVKNETDFKDLDSVQDKLQIKWNYVEAHRGLRGNEMADGLAKAGAAMYEK